MITLASLAALAIAPAATPPVRPAPPQDDEASKVLFVQGERVYVRPGKVLENAAVLVQDGRILAVGPDLVAPEGARSISGTVVCAGFVDPWSGFGLDAAIAALVVVAGTLLAGWALGDLILALTIVLALFALVLIQAARRIVAEDRAAELEPEQAEM